MLPALRSADTLNGHRVGDLLETGDVSADDVVAAHAVSFGGVLDVVEDVDHDVLELLVNLFERPERPHAGLRHLQSGACDAAGVCRLRGSELDAVVLEVLRRLDRAGHIRALSHRFDAVLDQGLGGSEIELVLRGMVQMPLQPATNFAVG